MSYDGGERKSILKNTNPKSSSFSQKSNARLASLVGNDENDFHYGLDMRRSQSKSKSYESSDDSKSDESETNSDSSHDNVSFASQTRKTGKKVIKESEREILLKQAFLFRRNNNRDMEDDDISDPISLDVAPDIYGNVIDNRPEPLFGGLKRKIYDYSRDDDRETVFVDNDVIRRLNNQHIHFVNSPFRIVDNLFVENPESVHDACLENVKNVQRILKLRPNVDLLLSQKVIPQGLASISAEKWAKTEISAIVMRTYLPKPLLSIRERKDILRSSLLFSKKHAVHDYSGQKNDPMNDILLPFSDSITLSSRPDSNTSHSVLDEILNYDMHDSNGNKKHHQHNDEDVVGGEFEASSSSVHNSCALSISQSLSVFRKGWILFPVSNARLSQTSPEKWVPKTFIREFRTNKSRTMYWKAMGLTESVCGLIMQTFEYLVENITLAAMMEEANNVSLEMRIQSERDMLLRSSTGEKIHVSRSHNSTSESLFSSTIYSHEHSKNNSDGHSNFTKSDTLEELEAEYTKRSRGYKSSSSILQLLNVLHVFVGVRPKNSNAVIIHAGDRFHQTSSSYLTKHEHKQKVKSTNLKNAAKKMEEVDNQVDDRYMELFESTLNLNRFCLGDVSHLEPIYTLTEAEINACHNLNEEFEPLFPKYAMSISYEVTFISKSFVSEDDEIQKFAKDQQKRRPDHALDISFINFSSESGEKRDIMDEEFKSSAKRIETIEDIQKTVETRIAFFKNLKKIYLVYAVILLRNLNDKSIVSSHALKEHQEHQFNHEAQIKQKCFQKHTSIYRLQRKKNESELNRSGNGGDGGFDQKTKSFLQSIQKNSLGGRGNTTIGLLSSSGQVPLDVLSYMDHVGGSFEIAPELYHHQEGKKKKRLPKKQGLYDKENQDFFQSLNPEIYRRKGNKLMKEDNSGFAQQGREDDITSNSNYNHESDDESDDDGGQRSRINLFVPNENNYDDENGSDCTGNDNSDDDNDEAEFVRLQMNVKRTLALWYPAYDPNSTKFYDENKSQLITNSIATFQSDEESWIIEKIIVCGLSQVVKEPHASIQVLSQKHENQLKPGGQMSHLITLQCALAICLFEALGSSSRVLIPPQLILQVQGIDEMNVSDMNMNELVGGNWDSEDENDDLSASHMSNSRKNRNKANYEYIKSQQYDETFSRYIGKHVPTGYNFHLFPLSRKDDPLILSEKVFRRIRESLNSATNYEYHSVDTMCDQTNSKQFMNPMQDTFDEADKKENGEDEQYYFKSLNDVESQKGQSKRNLVSVILDLHMVSALGFQIGKCSLIQDRKTYFDPTTNILEQLCTSQILGTSMSWYCNTKLPQTFALSSYPLHFHNERTGRIF